jgi:hypothetical protein
MGVPWDPNRGIGYALGSADPGYLFRLFFGIVKRVFGICGVFVLPDCGDADALTMRALAIKLGRSASDHRPVPRVEVDRVLRDVLGRVTEPCRALPRPWSRPRTIPTPSRRRRGRSRIRSSRSVERG